MNKKRWTKFTYVGKETRFITKLFKKTDIGIAYTTRDNLRHLLNNRTNNKQDIYNKSGVYKLTCTDCNKQYVGQTGRPFYIRYKEHAREYKYATNKTNYAKHLLDNQHAIKPIEECMTVLHATRKGPMLNTLERFYIYQATQNDNQLNDKNTVTTNPIFDVIMQHSKNGIPRFRTS
jgi:transposase-like protein